MFRYFRCFVYNCIVLFTLVAVVVYFSCCCCLLQLLLLFVIEGLYEAVGEYKAVNHDELNVKQGDTVQVINRCMDGWWEIRYSINAQV